MKTIFVQKQIIGWEEYKFKVPDDFKDYNSLKDSTDWISHEYLENSSEETGLVEMYDEDFNIIEL